MARRSSPDSQPKGWLWTFVGLLGIASAGSVVLLDVRTATLLRNTLYLSAATCAISVPLGSLLAWFLVRTDLWGRRAALILFGVMLFVPLYLQAAAWQAGFGTQGWLTLAGGGPVWLEGWAGAVWVHAMAALPWVVLIVGAGFWLVEPELEEQALLEAPPRRVLLHVTLPSAIGSVGVAALWVMILTAGEMTVTDLFMVRTYAEEIYTRLAVGPQPDDPPLGLMPGTMLTAWLVVAGLVLLARLLPRHRPISLRRRLVFRLGRWQGCVIVLVLSALLVVVAVPLASLCYKAGVEVTQVDSARLRIWSLGKCLEMAAVSPWRYAREFGWSLGIGTLAATAAVAAGTVLAWIARGRRLGAAAVLGLMAVCLAVPGPIVGLGVIRLLNRPEIPPLVYLYDQSILAPWLALVIRGVAPATLIMWHALRSVPDEMLESAALDGAGPLRRLCSIAIPYRWRAPALAWIVALAVALGDLAASILVVPPGVSTLSIHIFGLLHYGVEDRVAGICLAQAVLFAAVTAGVVWLASRWEAEG